MNLKGSNKDALRVLLTGAADFIHLLEQIVGGGKGVAIRSGSSIWVGGKRFISSSQARWRYTLNI